MNMKVAPKISGWYPQVQHLWDKLLDRNLIDQNNQVTTPGAPDGNCSRPDVQANMYQLIIDCQMIQQDM